MTVRDQRFIAFKQALRNVKPTVWGLYRPELLRFAD
jgi:hypothetical protein